MTLSLKHALLEKPLYSWLCLLDLAATLTFEVYFLGQTGEMEQAIRGRFNGFRRAMPTDEGQRTDSPMLCDTTPHFYASRLPLQVTPRAWMTRRAVARTAFSDQIKYLSLGSRSQRHQTTWTGRQTGEQYQAWSVGVSEDKKSNDTHAAWVCPSSTLCSSLECLGLLLSNSPSMRRPRRVRDGNTSHMSLPDRPATRYQ